MTTPAFDPYNSARFQAPTPPQEFGQDGGQFYRHYDALAEEIDDNFVNELKEQLEGLLIFAGLFAGINTAFLVGTLPSPADRTNMLLQNTNALLLNIALGTNYSLPFPELSPPERIPSSTWYDVTLEDTWDSYWFSISLTLTLVSSFFLILGREWLIYYHKRSGGGPDRQRWEQLKRFLGAKRWQLEWFLNTLLPAVFQAGFAIFCLALTGGVSLSSGFFNFIAFTSAMAIWFMVTCLAIWDKFCPFQTSLGRIFTSLMKPILNLIKWMLYSIYFICFRFAALLFGFMGDRPCLRYREFVNILALRFPRLRRREEDHGSLQIMAIRRALRTSDDVPTQTHAVANILAITDAQTLGLLAIDYEFIVRISDLCRSSYNRTLQLGGRDRVDLASATSWLYRAAIAHIVLSTAQNPRSSFAGKRWDRIFDGSLDEPQLSLPKDLVQTAQPNMVVAGLGFVACFSRSENSLHSALDLTIGGLVNPSWRCISMITGVIMVHWGLGADPHDVLHEAYTGKPFTILRNLEVMLKKSNDLQCRDRDMLRKYLVGVFKLTGKAVAGRSGSSCITGDVTAGLLRLSEGAIRGKDSSSHFINVVRDLRGELIRTLQLECRGANAQKGEYTSEETLKELIQLFSELTARLKPPAIASDSSLEGAFEVLREWPLYWEANSGASSKEDDLELVNLFSPFSHDLNTVMMERNPSWAFPVKIEAFLKFKQQVEELNTIFASFKAAVWSVSREIKREERDPDQRWCYYSRENLNLPLGRSRGRGGAFVRAIT